MGRTLVLLVIGAIVGAACSDPTDLNERTLLVEFDHTPTTADNEALSDRGAEVTLLVRAVRGLLIRGDVQPGSFEEMAGVTAVKDLGSDDDPFVSVFIHTTSAPTEADLEFVRQAGGSQVRASSSDLFMLILGQMRVSTVDGLLGYDRFTEINVYPNTLGLA